MNTENNNPAENAQQQQQKPARRPDEKAGFDISGVVTIYDPETREVFVKVRTWTTKHPLKLKAF